MPIRVKSAVAALLLAACANLAEAADSFKLTSTDIADGKMMSMAQVANTFGCSGGNISPELSWSGAPATTKSFVLTAYDPDAPTGSGFWHWVVFNIPASVTKLDGGVKADALPAGTVQARSDYGSIGFGGACPPPGKPHRYIFTVYALKVDKLDLDANATPAVVGFMTNANAIGKATLTAKYGR